MSKRTNSKVIFTILNTTIKKRFQNGTLIAPIQLSINGLLYYYNKCNDNLHLLSISYSLIRSDFCLGL